MENIFFEQKSLLQSYHNVFCLTETTPSKELLASFPTLPRGWAELALFPKEDRIEFTRLFWHSKLPDFTEKIDLFFAQLTSLEILLVQERLAAPYLPLMLYQKKETVFFGAPPASPPLLARIRQQYNHLPLPPDYLSFFHIHDGFHKNYDRGLFPLRDLSASTTRFKERLPSSSPLLFPFCELENVHQFQCFYSPLAKNCLANLLFDELESSDAPTSIFESFTQWLENYVHSQ